ncbi:hypothetical protein P280DRAFT_528998 [Massarina eburnea CBS 473.64]|uniref:Gfd2/YDR514C-like C-terminal domain-containing protein n=1 Tax=Massarina eburnea CBS 473.64 TaxID=1395130 RepID=A0A6A6RU73_9PLEO|nr:hypothetical protein P280DRAFT_528998 [Massarina eburnea CBS 473.64]
MASPRQNDHSSMAITPQPKDQRHDAIPDTSHTDDETLSAIRQTSEYFVQALLKSETDCLRHLDVLAFLRGVHSEVLSQVPKLVRKTLTNAILVAPHFLWNPRGVPKPRIVQFGITAAEVSELQKVEYLKGKPLMGLEGVVDARHYRIIEDPQEQITKPDLVPTDFLYGTSQTITAAEGVEQLRRIFVHRSGSSKSLRPVIFIGSNIRGQINGMKDLGFDVDAAGVVCLQLDAQDMSQEIDFFDIRNPSGNTLLWDLISSKYQYRRKNPNNSGNNAADTFMAAFFLLHDFVQPRPYVIYINPEVEAFQESLREKNGHEVSCTSCASDQHTVTMCKHKVHCEHCGTDPLHNQYAHTHRTELCPIVLAGGKGPLPHITPMDSAADKNDTSIKLASLGPQLGVYTGEHIPPCQRCSKSALWAVREVASAHSTSTCRYTLPCAHCSASNSSILRKRLAYDHETGKCSWYYSPCMICIYKADNEHTRLAHTHSAADCGHYSPCLHCLDSQDQVRVKLADTHLTKNCSSPPPSYKADYVPRKPRILALGTSMILPPGAGPQN